MVALTPWSFAANDWSGVSMVGYCIPNAEQLTAYTHISTYPSVTVACPAYVCDYVGGEATLTFADFARQPPGATYLLMGFSSSAAANDAQVAKPVSVLHLGA